MSEPDYAAERRRRGQRDREILRMSEPDYAAERRLPEDKTCCDCRHGRHCDALFGAMRQRFTSCDFWPSLFDQVNVSSEQVA